jgi:integrase/recombinase XerC
MANLTITQTISAYLDTVRLARSENTARTYRNALSYFLNVLKNNNYLPNETPISNLTENAISLLAGALKDCAPTTERLYLSAASGFYRYLASEGLAPINLPRLELLIRQRARRPGQRLPQFKHDSIEKTIEYAINLAIMPVKCKIDRIRALRDRSFILTLADTGLRVHEACSLRRGDLDWNEYKAVIIGKGDKQAIVRFSSRAISSVKDYLNARSTMDGASGRPLTALPIFARHDRGAGNKILPITTTTGRNIIKQRVLEALGEDAVGTITPHSFRHYFVTTVLRGSSGNLKLAQELARHKNIAITQRYAHLTDDELDHGYWEVFENG